MRLADLEPQFYRWERRQVPSDRFVDGVMHTSGVAEYYIKAATIAEAQGVRFLCPKCFAANNGPVGTHSVICWSRSRGVPDDVSPGPGRWTLDGTGLHDLTLNGDPPGTARSVQLESGCSWHGHVTNGEVT